MLLAFAQTDFTCNPFETGIAVEHLNLVLIGNGLDKFGSHNGLYDKVRRLHLAGCDTVLDDVVQEKQASLVAVYQHPFAFVVLACHTHAVCIRITCHYDVCINLLGEFDCHGKGFRIFRIRRNNCREISALYHLFGYTVHILKAPLFQGSRNEYPTCTMERSIDNAKVFLTLNHFRINGEGMDFIQIHLVYVLTDNLNQIFVTFELDVLNSHFVYLINNGCIVRGKHLRTIIPIGLVTVVFFRVMACSQVDTTDFKCKLAGEVKDFDPESVVDKKEVRKMARFTLLALGAAAEAIADSGLDTEAEGKDIGVILSSGIGGLPTIEEQHARGEEKGMEKVSPYFVPMAIANMAAAQVAIRFGLKGMCTCPVTACAGGTNAVGDAFHRIRDGYEPVMVCGGAESCISPLGIGGFTSMKALSTATDPDAASLPFDARRGGFVMGEGSGVLVLEELEHARARGAHIYAEVVGYGANCDAYHFTAPAPGGAGAIDCMKLTLVDADIAPEQVDHINAHGTGTHMNDACETAAIHAVFGAHAKEMTVVSTKSMTGHLLGGAGGIEAVFTALALRDQFAPPTIHYAQPDPECDLDYVPNTGRQQEMQYALSNSLGFGGHNACIALRRWEG